jgi:hypothetical protein
MKDRLKKTSELEAFIADVERRQRNVVWPDPLVNARSVDQFFWSGSPSPTGVQRVAAWLIGLIFIGLSAGFLNFLVLERVGGPGDLWCNLHCTSCVGIKDIS